MIEKNCVYCNVIFSVYPSSKSKCCSLSCGNKLKWKGDEYKNKMIEIYSNRKPWNSDKNHPKYNDWIKSIKKPDISKCCLQCNENFFGKSYHLKNRKFCNLICAYEYRIGKSHPSPEKQREIFRNIGFLNKGKKHSEEVNKKKGRTGKLNGMYGKTHIGIPLKKIKERRLLQIFPKYDSSIEIKFQKELKQRNISFKKYWIINNIEHKYQCDIFIEPNIVIECDGNYWHKYPNHTEKDVIRTNEMNERGYVVFRFWESEINNNAGGCVDEIEEYLFQTNNKEVYEPL